MRQVEARTKRAGGLPSRCPFPSSPVEACIQVQYSNRSTRFNYLYKNKYHKYFEKYEVKTKVGPVGDGNCSPAPTINQSSHRTTAESKLLFLSYDPYFVRMLQQKPPWICARSHA